jgi:hypothetical protein
MGAVLNQTLRTDWKLSVAGLKAAEAETAKQEVNCELKSPE